MEALMREEAKKVVDDHKNGLAQILKEPRKHLFRIDAVVEAGAPSLDRAGDIVKRRAKDEVTESPCHQLLIECRQKMVLLRHLRP